MNLLPSVRIARTAMPRCGNLPALRHRAVWCLVLFASVTASAVQAQDEPSQDVAELVQDDAPSPAIEQPPPTDADEPARSAPRLTIRKLLNDGGVIGMIILGLSVAMMALVIEHVISIRRGALMPHGLAEYTHQLLMQGQAKQAEETCQASGSYLGRVLAAGLDEVGIGYASIEKAMEDASVEQSARLFRKIEYLSVIGTLAPMLGLLGTVWGMILAFMEFEQKANPQVAELAPGIYGALVTTLFGLVVAVPALAFYAFFRNRIDELAAEASLLAEHVFADYKRMLAAQRKRPSDRSSGPRRSPGGPQSA